ncbi:hypothetical protein LXL04_035024 [Taraxacum kok-saghyz]
MDSCEIKDKKGTILGKTSTHQNKTFPIISKVKIFSPLFFQQKILPFYENRSGHTNLGYLSYMYKNSLNHVKVAYWENILETLSLKKHHGEQPSLLNS